MADRRISLLHFFPSFSYGGQQRRLGALVAGLGDGFRHSVYAFDGDLGGAALLGKTGRVAISPFPLEKSGLVSLRNVRRLRDLMAQSGGDLVCTYNFGSIEAVIANKFGARLPLVHHEDGFGPDEAAGRQKLKRVLARRILLSDVIVTVPSTALERVARDVWRLRPTVVRKIPVGIDVSRFAKAVRAERVGRPVVVGSIGSLRKEKNYERLIRCFRLAAPGDDARLVIFGDGPERDNLAASASGDPRISLPGATPRPDEALAAIDIFALSSDTEQTPISLMEAMAAGLPALATDVGDVRAMLGDGVGSFVVASEDETTYVARLSQLIGDGVLRKVLGDANRDRAAMFDERAMVGAFRALYRDAVGRRAAD